MIALADGHIFIRYEKDTDKIHILELNRENVAPKRTTMSAMEFLNALSTPGEDD